MVVLIIKKNQSHGDDRLMKSTNLSQAVSSFLDYRSLLSHAQSARILSIPYVRERDFQDTPDSGLSKRPNGPERSELHLYSHSCPHNSG
jgi:hypothetical protein